MTLFSAHVSVELRKVASGSATQDLWLRNGKLGSQVSSIDQSRFPRRRTVGEIWRGGRRGREPATEQRRVYTDLGLDLGEREEQVVCHASALALAMTDKARRKAEV